jgi:hypothetical protein
MNFPFVCLRVCLPCTYLYQRVCLFLDWLGYCERDGVTQSREDVVEVRG